MEMGQGEKPCPFSQLLILGKDCGMDSAEFVDFDWNNYSLIRFFKCC